MKRVLTVLPLLFVLSACGGASADALKTTIFENLDKLPKMLEGIKDKASFDSAKGGLEKIVEAVSGAKKGLEALPESEETKKISGEVTSKLGSMTDVIKGALGKIGDAGIVDQIKKMLAKIIPGLA